MLSPYTYVPHQIEKMQQFIDFIFFEVWCKAPIGVEFHPDLFDGKPELKEIMSEFGFSQKAAKRGKNFYRDVKAIYEDFATLSPSQIQQFKKWYWGNNDLKKVCLNNPAAQVVRYADMEAEFTALSERLKDFFPGLYSQSLLGLAAFRSKIGEIDDHYKKFTLKNKAKCRFCGISDLLGPDHSHRDAYDHYLPKATYPFNSINFQNLVPTCHHCNGSYKLEKDPAFTPKDANGLEVRRKVFHPFSTKTHRISVHVDLRHADYEKLAPTDITFSFGPLDLTEQIETWKDIYGIEERYLAKLRSEDGKAWLTQALEEWPLRQKTNGVPGEAIDAYLEALARHAEASPYANANFLKQSFLVACKSIGMLESSGRTGP